MTPIQKVYVTMIVSHNLIIYISNMSTNMYDYTRLNDYDKNNLIVSLDCSINEGKKNEYLSLLPYERKNVIRYLLDNTRYILYSEFSKKLEDTYLLIKESIKDLEEFHILVSGDKIGSEVWVLAHIYDRISKLKGFKGIITDFDETTKNIVIIDDCIYSGGNIGSFIDGSVYLYAASILPNKPKKVRRKNYNTYNEYDKYSNEYKIKYEEYSKLLLNKYTEILKSINFYVMAPYAYKAGIKGIKNLEANITFCIGEIIEPITIDSTEEIMKWLKNEMYINVWKGATNCVYFQHKVAIDTSTLESVYVKGKIDETHAYGTILNNIPDRAQIKQLEAFLSRKSGGYNTRRNTKKNKKRKTFRHSK